jgi:hypothetical protein
MTWHTFLSYSRQQYHSAESLAIHLQKRGLNIWFDVQQLEPGTDWQQDIQAGLDQSGTVLLLASRAALDSSYVEREWQRALELGRPVIVALVERVRLPRDLHHAPVIDCRGEFEAGVEQVHRAILNPSAPTPRVSPLPRLSPGVRRSIFSLLLHDLHRIGIILVAIAMWALLFQQASLPRLSLDWLLPQIYGGSWALSGFVPWLFAGGLLLLFVRLIGASLDIRTLRFLRHDLYTTILAPLKKSHIRLPGLLWLALASGYIPAVSEYYTPLGIQPTALPLLVLLASLTLTFWCLGWVYQRLLPRLPDADLLRWAMVDGVPDTWRTQVYGDWAYRAMFPVASPTTTQVEPRAAGTRLRVVVELADLPVLDTIRPLIRGIGAVIESPGAPTDYDLLILSHASSRQRVAAVLEAQARILGIIASRFTIPPELEGLRKVQLIDFSHQDRDSLLAALRLLTVHSDAERTQLQPYLEPVNLARTAPPKIVQQMAGSLLSLVLLTLLMLGLVAWQRDTQAEVVVPMSALAVTALLLLVSNDRARRGRLPMPRWGMIVLAFLPLILMSVIALELPSQVSLGILVLPLYPIGWVMLLGTTALTAAWFVVRFIRHPHTLGGDDIFGMPPIPLRLLSSVGWIAGCMALIFLFSWQSI